MHGSLCQGVRLGFALGGRMYDPEGEALSICSLYICVRKDFPPNGGTTHLFWARCLVVSSGCRALSPGAPSFSVADLDQSLEQFLHILPEAPKISSDKYNEIDVRVSAYV